MLTTLLLQLCALCGCLPSYHTPSIAAWDHQNCETPPANRLMDMHTSFLPYMLYTLGTSTQKTWQLNVPISLLQVFVSMLMGCDCRRVMMERMFDQLSQLLLGLRNLVVDEPLMPTSHHGLIHNQVAEAMEDWWQCSHPCPLFRRHSLGVLSVPDCGCVSFNGSQQSGGRGCRHFQLRQWVTPCPYPLRSCSCQPGLSQGSTGA